MVSRLTATPTLPPSSIASTCCPTTVALLAVPIVNRGTTIGSVWFEDERRRSADWSPETRTFARAIAGMLALRLTAAMRAGSGSAW